LNKPLIVFLDMTLSRSDARKLEFFVLERVMEFGTSYLVKLILHFSLIRNPKFHFS